MILQFAPHIDVTWSRGSNSRRRMPKEVSGLCNGRVRPIPKANKGIGKRVSKFKISNSYSLAPVIRLLTTVSKITRPVRLKSPLGIGQYATRSPDRGGIFYTNA